MPKLFAQFIGQITWANNFSLYFLLIDMKLHKIQSKLDRKNCFLFQTINQFHYTISIFLVYIVQNIIYHLLFAQFIKDIFQVFQEISMLMFYYQVNLISI